MAYPLTHAAVAARIGLALAAGLLVGFEREWANKEAGIRTCALTALLGALAEMVSPGFAMAGLAAVLVLVAFLNLRALRAAQAVEITTSAALLLVYVLGVLAGRGGVFTPLAAAVAVTLLLAWKLELHRFAGALQLAELRSAVWLAVLAFVIEPLLPNRALDRWGVFNPHMVWVAVLVLAAVGFGNYVLLRLYSARGLYYSAVLGGLVNSTATVLELGATLRELGEALLPLGVTATLLATLGMLVRNLALLALFSRTAGLRAALPLAAMAAAAAGLAWMRGSHWAPPAGTTLRLRSPLSLGRLAEFGALFVAVQVFTLLGERAWGSAGTYAVALVGGIFFSSATTAAMGLLALHGGLAPGTAAAATVLASIASVLSNAVVMNRLLRQRRLGWTNDLLALLLAGVGVVLLALLRA